MSIGTLFNDFIYRDITVKTTLKKITHLVCLLALSGAASANETLLVDAITGKHRTENYVARDDYRNPLKTLSLFDVQPHHTVLEIWPGGGWYTEILAPYLRKKGQLIAAHYDSGDTQAGYRAKSRASFEKKMSQTPKVYSKVKVASLMFDEANASVKIPAAEKNSVDRVVTFRNAHGWFASGVTNTAFQHFFDVLKTGGKLGIVQHQADTDQDWMSKNIGYVGRDYIIASALKAGFVLEAEGFFNSNALDTKRYAQGVWQLPPSYRSSKTDEQKAIYKAIGESDRMTLVFIKP